MAAHKFSRREVEKVRAEIADLHLVGLPQHEIANRVGLRQQAVAYHLKVIAQRWRESQVEHFGTVRERLIEELRLSRRELWAAWERSKRERKSTTTRQRKLPAAAVAEADGLIAFPGGAGGGERVEREARVRLDEHDPDVHYQLAITKSVELEAKLLGMLEEPPKAGNADEPIRRVVVYMERGDAPAEPLPPGPPSDLGNGRVIDVPAPGEPAAP